MSVLLGCPFVPLNPRLACNGEEVRHILNQISPSVIIVVGQETKGVLQDNAGEQLRKAQLLISLEEQGNSATGLEWLSLTTLWSCTHLVRRDKWAGPTFDDTTIIGFTSGTTSLPKACPQSSDNLMTSALAVRDLRELGPTDRLCQHLPSFAAMAVLISLTCGISGATIVYPSPSFSATATLDAIENERCTYTFAAPAIVKALAMHPTITQRSLDSLRIVELGGAPIYSDVLQLATSKHGLNCKRVGCGWGMTESPAPLLARPWERGMPLPIDYVPVGKPIRGTFAKICLPGSREPVTSGQDGELHVGGPQVVRGYLNGDNESFYDETGIHWIRTGDMARFENGQVYIISRYKDIIIRGGQNISPAKIERILEKVSSVEAQVVGIPDDFAGEVPVAVIKLTDQEHPHVDTIIQGLRDTAMSGLGPTETPHAFISLAELGLDHFPTTLSGKIKKAELAERVREYFRKEHRAVRDVPQATSTEAILLELWSKVSGVPISSIEAHASVFSFADSITTMRLSTLVKKQLQKDLTVDDVAKHPSIHGQAKLLDKRSMNSSSGPLNRRFGPPTAIDMVHCNGDPSKVVATENVVAPFLSQLNLTWNDVEDVFPAPDTSYIYLNRQRPQTWNQRVIYLAFETDVETLAGAWKAVLVHHAMFRTVAVPTTAASSKDARYYFVVLRPTETFWSCSITTNLEVKHPEDLRSTFNDEWADTLVGPLVRIAFVRIKSSASSAFIFVGNHAAYDNLAMDLLFSDLETALSHRLTAENILQAPGHVPFKKFSDQYYYYRSTKEAQEAATFHANRLRGIGHLQDSLWPKARSPGFFKGPDAGWTHNDGTPGDPALRIPVDPPEERRGLDGLTRIAPVYTLQAMKEKHGIMPHVILKVAVALFNMRKNGTTTALFANVEASRRWPSSVKTEEVLPNPLDIAGPMFQVVLNRLSLTRPNESVLNVLQRVQEEQKLLSENSQAPLSLIHSFLPYRDGEVFFDALRRQGYNWAPGIQSSSRTSTDKPPTLIKFNRQALDDIGLAWTCGLRDREKFYINASYDDCQLGKEEIYEYLGEVLSAGVWLSDPDNVEKGVDECMFDGGDVSELIKSLE